MARRAVYICPPGLPAEPGPYRGRAERAGWPRELLARVLACPREAEHNYGPGGYIEHYEWAEATAKDWRQKPCECGLYLLLEPKRKVAPVSDSSNTTEQPKGEPKPRTRRPSPVHFEPGPSAEELHVRQWMKAERRYVQTKLGDQTLRDPQGDEVENAALEGLGLADPHYLRRIVNQYFDRAFLLGLNTARGKQAWMKGTMTAVRVAEAMVRDYGRLPIPGYPSGDILGGDNEPPPPPGSYNRRVP